MAEVKVQRDTKIFVALSEDEATALAAVLVNCVDFDTCPVAAAVFNALEENDINGEAVVVQFNKGTKMFEVKP
jgi:hypothetical protein